MDVTRWQLIRALFDDLIELDPSAWEQALLLRCPDDAELREEVLEMLRADVEARGAPSRLADRSPELLGEMADADDAQQVQGWIGRQLGAWRIVRPLGRGGMGMVYLAEREGDEFKQQAAIKLLRTSDDAIGLKRFLAERRILAELEHPHIARLLDGGSIPNGGPWFALEYVDGVSLTAWCDSRRLELRDRLNLVLDICAAVSFAHDRLVVHRDLKPANILVDSGGQVKLLDFGIASLLDAEADQTGTALRVFTPDYAAPEQVRGERATAATDVYALGVILYELLTGRRPYVIRERTSIAIERAVLTNDPQRPSNAVTQQWIETNTACGDVNARAANRRLAPGQLRARLRGDLDAIVLKALRKEPHARYASVREFADDLRSAISLRPVQARRGGLRYKADRFLRRNAAIVSLSIAVFLALTFGLVAALLQAHETRLQRDAASREAATAQAALEFMERLFQVADPRVARGREVSARELLDQGSSRIRNALLDQPAARGRLLLAMGDAYIGLGLDAQALPMFDDALALARAHDDEALSKRVVLGRATALQGLGRFQEVLDELTPIRSELPVSGKSGAILQAAEFDYRLGLAAQSLGKDNEAEDYFSQALKVREAALGLTHAQTRDVFAALITLYVLQGRYVEALEYAQRSVAAFSNIMGSDDPIFAGALSTLAMVRTNVGPIDEAERLRRQALEIYRNVYGNEHTITLREINNLAGVLFSQRRFADALPMFEEVLEAWRKLYGANHPTVAAAANNTSVAYLMTGDATTALTLAEEGLTIRIASFGHQHTNTAQSLLALGSAKLNLGLLDEAEAALSEGRDVIVALLGSDSEQLISYHNNLARVSLARPGKPADCDHNVEAMRLLGRSTLTPKPLQLYTRALYLACRARRGESNVASELQDVVKACLDAVRQDDPYVTILRDIVSRRADPPTVD